ncbi:hypothetical protein [Caproiciproducens faecalis]|uniref:DUF2007 domain-containing protein n=1 Tax=Caproiciproducens faecalis TaxID=2820301 RepID=A0ABS7DNB4_9FIRM|nr:hypothetical protein [Caproiciproducens faecalis]MBW7572708.1 hypothetical protein [Caproiciproducens faecalis]
MAVFPWNRREVSLGFSEKEFMDIRQKLHEGGIPCETRIVNAQAGGMRTRLGSFGINREYEYQYYIYVKKCDYEKAAFLLKK